MNAVRQVQVWNQSACTESQRFYQSRKYPYSCISSENTSQKPLSLENHMNERNQNRLFVGGITLSVDICDLQTKLEDAIQAGGEVTITMVDRASSNTFSGYGYISTTNPSDQSRLLALRTFKYKECWIGIKPFLTRKTDIRKQKEDKSNRKLHIKGLNHRITESDLENHFRRYGQINHVQINKSQTTGHYKGFAFIEFANQNAVDKIMKTTQHSIKGVSLICEKSKIKQVDGGLHLEHNNCSDKFNLPNTLNSLTQVRPRTFRPTLPKATYLRVEQNHAIDNLQFHAVKPRHQTDLVDISSLNQVHQASQYAYQPHCARY
jgi:RNA recognition motif. (a.k.a. RRM, RBD, or RNP domain)